MSTLRFLGRLRPHLSILLVCLVAAFALPTSGLGGTAVYVHASSGNDNNSGTKAKPLRTLQECLDRWSGGGQWTCYGTGTFREELLLRYGGPSPGQKNRITAWDTDNDGQLDDETFVLDGGNTRSVAILLDPPKPNNVEISWLTFRNYKPASGCTSAAHFVFFRDGPGGADWWLHHNIFERLGTNCDAVKGANVVAIRPHGAPRLKVSNNIFRDIGGYILRYFGGADIQIVDNDIEIDATGIKIWGDDVDRPVISGNTFHCDGNGQNPPGGRCDNQFGVAFSNDVRNGVVRDNLFYDCPSAVGLFTGEAYGSRPNTGTRVEGNTIHQSPKVCNPYEAPLLVSDCTGNSDLTGSPLYVKDIVFRNNVVQYEGGQRAGPGFFMSAGHPTPFQSNLVIENNSFSNYSFGVRVDQCGQNYPYQLNNVTVRNNIWSSISVAYYTLSFSGWTGPLPINWTSNHNTFSGTSLMKWPHEMSIAQWRSATAQDGASRQCSPKFASPIGMRLSPDDTCAVDRGENRPGLQTDIEGDTRPSGKVDIGADELCVGAQCACLFCDGFEQATAGHWSDLP